MNPPIMQYADYYQMYLDSWEDCTQETFEACSENFEVYQAKMNNWLFSRISAESAIA